MLFLSFKLGDDRYALDANHVVEIIPLVDIKSLAHSSPVYPGVFNYRGQFVTATDLCELTLHRPAEKRLGTRIIIVRHPGLETHLLGLIAEEVTGTLRKERTEFVESSAGGTGGMPVFPVLMDERGAIHLLDESRLLSDSLRNQLAHVVD